MSFDNNLPRGASYEMRTVRTKSSNVLYRGNQFERIDSADQATQTVRVLHEGKLSIAGSSKPGSSEELLKQAAEMVRYGSPYDVPFVGEADVTPLELANEESLTSKQMIEMMGGFVEELRKLDNRLVASASLSSLAGEVSLKTSNGFDHSYRKSVWTCGCFIELMQGDDLLNIFEFRKDMTPSFDLKDMVNTVAQKLEHAMNVVQFKPGAYPVIFAPREVGNIINPVVQSLNGQAVYRKISPWSDKLGQELLDKRFNLIDNGALDKSWTSIPFDLEGTPTRRNVLVQNGVLGDLIMNRKVAVQLGKESSGNAAPSGPAPHYLQLDPGSKTLEELISSIDYGLLVDDTMGAWSGNPYGGIVSGTISMGLKIEKGKIVGRVKDCMFTINAFEHFKKHLIDCSTERKQAELDFFSAGLFPHILLDEVVVSTE